MKRCTWCDRDAVVWIQTNRNRVKLCSFHAMKYRETLSEWYIRWDEEPIEYETIAE